MAAIGTAYAVTSAAQSRRYTLLRRALTQKQCPAMALLRPSVDLRRGTLQVVAPPATALPSLMLSLTAAATQGADVRVCGERTCADVGVSGQVRIRSVVCGC